jgi:hypothetical protein
VIGYAARVLPWRLTLTSCTIIAGLMSLVAAWPWVMWPLQGTSVGVIAGAVAWAMDERAAAVVDTLPRSLRWRTAARGLIVVPLLGLWIVVLVLMRDRVPAHLDLFIMQGAAAVAVALAFTVWRRTNAVAEPGRSFAALALAATTALALVRPLSRGLPLFPLWPSDNWPLSYAVWLTVLTGSLAALTRLLARPQ